MIVKLLTEAPASGGRRSRQEAEEEQEEHRLSCRVIHLVSTRRRELNPERRGWRWKKLEAGRGFSAFSPAPKTAAPPTAR